MPNAQLTVNVRQDTPQLKVVALGGSLTLETVAGFNQQFREDPVSAMVLDLAELTWLDSAGVGALVQLLVRRSKEQHALALAALSPRNQGVLQVAQVMKLFAVYKTADEAAAALGTSGSAQRSA